MVKEPTASVFVFHHGPDGRWRCALVWHPRLGAWLPAGGHVERDENAAEAALREVTEETGLTARLVPGPCVPLPARFPHPAVAAPWWIVEMAAGADGHTPIHHAHIDHIFLAIADTADTMRPPEHAVRWFTAQQIIRTPAIAEDSRLQAKELFSRIDEVADHA